MGKWIGGEKKIILFFSSQEKYSDIHLLKSKDTKHLDQVFFFSSPLLSSSLDPPSFSLIHLRLSLSLYSF